jgi:hypothetical protein
VDIAIHRPHREGDQRNHHAHLLTTTRCVTREGLGAKTDVELSNSDRLRQGLRSASDEMTYLRGRWAALANERLLEHGHEQQIDHRTLKAQGIEREPTQHRGPQITAIERREKKSLVLERQREEAAERLAKARELGDLEREQQWLNHSILDLSNDLRAALWARDHGHEQKLSLDEERQRGREAWLASRERELMGFPDRQEEHKNEREHQRDYGLGLGDD